MRQALIPLTLSCQIAESTVFQPRLLRVLGQSSRFAGWLLITIACPLMIGQSAAQASEVLHVQSPSGQHWLCRPLNRQLICDPVTPAAVTQSNTPFLQIPTVPPAPSGNWTDLILRAIYIGIPSTFVGFFFLQSLQNRLHKAKMQAFVQRLERIWQQSAQH
ncbi:hypothetical protein ACN4EG_20435 [Alkalinema pantanalense CENA528]|uniref:hypothetical protein n=1 Tax=Alkalinema pantanalense TaxID=1620705 RepID=UPI003D6EE971